MKFYSENNKKDYRHFDVGEDCPLLEFLLANVKGESRSKIKATLQGRGIKVNGKTVTQFDYPLKAGMKVAVSKSKRNTETFKNRYVKIVYEDRFIVVIEKNIGILSMAAGHSSLNVKRLLQKEPAEVYRPRRASPRPGHQRTDDLRQRHTDRADIGTQLARHCL